MRHTRLCVARKFGPFVSPNLGTFYPFWPSIAQHGEEGAPRGIKPEELLTRMIFLAIC